VPADTHDAQRQVATLLLRAIRPDGVEGGAPADPTRAAEVVRVIGDVWLASLVKWVTGRASADDVAGSIEVAVRLLLRPH
jgi:hypothetical protein